MNTQFSRCSEPSLLHVTYADHLPHILSEGLAPRLAERALASGESQKAVFAHRSIAACHFALRGWFGERYQSLTDESGNDISLAIIEFDGRGLKELFNPSRNDALIIEPVGTHRLSQIYSSRIFFDKAYQDFIKSLPLAS